MNPKWQHELAWYYKQGKLVSYFLNNAAKTCLYGLKISENIEIGHFFQSGTFFGLSSNLHTSCLSLFKVETFETFNSSRQNLSNSLCQIWNDKSIPLQIMYLSSVSWKITPLYVFSSNNIYFTQKEPIKVKIFQTFKCSGQNLSNSFCQFWNDKLIPLRILYPSSVSWKITHLYFFSSSNIYFAQKEPIKLKIFETFNS